MEKLLIYMIVVMSTRHAMDTYWPHEGEQMLNSPLSVGNRDCWKNACFTTILS